MTRFSRICGNPVLMVVLAHLWGAAATAAPAAVTAATPPVDPAPPFYRGSTLALRNTAGAIGLNPAAEPTYNPYYALQLSMQPRAWLNPQLYARGSFDIASELTQSDSTNDPAVIGDLGLAVGADSFYSIPKLGVDVSTELAFSLPTSKASQASTRVLASGVSLGLSRKFGKLTLSYSGGAEKYWNRYTTGAPTAQLVGVCDLSLTSGCVDMLVQSGRRNADWNLNNGLSASFKALTWLSVSVGAGLSTVFLYPLPDAPEISLHTRQTSSERYLMFSSVGLSVKPNDLLTIALGARAVHGQIAPDGSYRAPLVNRFTQLYLELGVNIASLVSRLKS